jgi:hypothetical protein
MAATFPRLIFRPERGLGLLEVKLAVGDPGPHAAPPVPLAQKPLFPTPRKFPETGVVTLRALNMPRTVAPALAVMAVPPPLLVPLISSAAPHDEKQPTAPLSVAPKIQMFSCRTCYCSHSR